jgi:hypothetical protein
MLDGNRLVELLQVKRLFELDFNRLDLFVCELREFRFSFGYR